MTYWKGIGNYCKSCDRYCGDDDYCSDCIDHINVCNECGEYYDMRDLGEVFKHEHKGLPLDNVKNIKGKIVPNERR